MKQLLHSASNAIGDPRIPALRYLLTAEEAKTKSVGGKEYPASDFLYVGDPNDISTWSLPVPDEAHVRDAMSRFDQDEVIPAPKKKAIAKKLAAKATKLGIDATNFKKQFVSAEADISHEQLHPKLDAAMGHQFGNDENGNPRFRRYETFDKHVIAGDKDHKLYRIPYTVGDDGDGDVDFGDAQEVSTAYVPVAEACEFDATAEADAATPAPGRYKITILKPGWGNGSLGGQAIPHYYPPEFVSQVAEAATGKPFGRKHPDQKGPDPTGATQPERIAGWIDGTATEGTKATGYVNLFSAETALRSNLDEARSARKLNLFGISMLAAIGWKPGVIDGKQCLVAESLGDLYSVDLCARAGAGGEFLTAAAFAADDISAAQLRAVNPQSAVIAPMRVARDGSRGGAASATEGASMKKSILQLLEALRQKNAARCAELSLKFANVAEADYPSFLEEVTTEVAKPVTAPVVTMTAEAAQAILADAQRLQSRNRIAAKLVESKLPEAARKLTNTHLESALAAEANLSDAVIDAEIAQVRDAFAAFNPVGRMQPGSQVVLDSADKMHLAMEAAIGVKESVGKGVPPFRGLKDAYMQITGDYNLDKLRAGGGFTGQAVSAEAVLSGDFPNILLNSMTKRLLQDWAELALDGLSNLYTKQSISDYKLQDRVREGYFPELATVAEGAAYQEIVYPTDELVTYQVGKYGNLLSISEETIRNDDLGAIARFPGRLARAGRWTLKNYITNFFVNNPNYTADGVAWFNAAHNNLSTIALSQDSLITAEVSLLTQTEKNSGEPLGLSLDWLMVPPALAATARQINQTNTAGSNAFFQRFGVNNERIYVNEKLADLNDWYYGTNQNNAPFIEMGFLDGIENPQIFLANQPTIGTQFTMDELQYKVKMAFAGAIIDFRGVGKAVVA